jgi:NADH:ubiquinone oxidoreductase subunit 5 (subunit L)/multisubunit Na+/H+ antiporter MnhA subunit
MVTLIVLMVLLYGMWYGSGDSGRLWMLSGLWMFGNGMLLVVMMLDVIGVLVGWEVIGL